MYRVLLALLFSLTAPVAQAGCNGQDLRQNISTETRTRLNHAIAQVPFAQGNHWIARKAGQRIHVVGTMHLGDSRMHAVMRKLRPAIKAANVVFLEQNETEGDESEERRMQTQKKHFLLPKGVLLQDLLAPKDWQELQRLAPLVDISSDFAPFLQPWVFSVVYGSSSCGVRGITGQRGLDARIQRFAHRQKIPVGGLEKPGDGLRAFSGRPLKDQVKLLELNMRSQVNNNDLAVTQREAYFDENLTEGWILNHWLRILAVPDNQREAKRLIEQLDKRLQDDRNRAWMPVLLGRKEPVIFVAVGAAHLPGKAGLLSLLQRQGFTLERAAYK